MLSLLMAHRYPEDVKGLILANPPSDNRDITKPLVEAWYWVLADAAERGGMQEVIQTSSSPPGTLCTTAFRPSTKRRVGRIFSPPFRR